MEENNDMIKLIENQPLSSQLVKDVKLIVERGLRDAYNGTNFILYYLLNYIINFIY